MEEAPPEAPPPAPADTCPNPAGTDKPALRRMLRDRRRRFVAALPLSTRTLAFRALPSPVQRLLPAGGVVALYHATGDEAPTERLAERLAEVGHPLALPRFDAATGAMHFAAWAPGEALVPGAFRALEPSADAAIVTPAVIVAPLVGFDAALNRLGQGGGHYDRAFAAYPDARRIGLAWSVQGVDALPAEPFDIPLDLVVTEAAVHARQEP